MTYLEKVKKLFGGKLPKSFSLHMKYGEFKPSEKELAAKSFFKVLMTDINDKEKAEKLGLIKKRNIETITLKIDLQSKAGKAFKEALKAIYSKQQGIEVVKKKSS